MLLLKIDPTNGFYPSTTTIIFHGERFQRRKGTGLRMGNNICSWIKCNGVIFPCIPRGRVNVPSISLDGEGLHELVNINCNRRMHLIGDVGASLQEAHRYQLDMGDILHDYMSIM